MSPAHIMVVAGEPSGDLLAAELVTALRRDPAVRTLPFAPRFFGAGGPRMAAAGVELAADLTRHAVVGIVGVVRKYLTFRRLFHQLVELAAARQPAVVVCVDFGGFNRRLARAIRQRLREDPARFHNWRPQLVQYVSPQVWASRPGRAYAMARDLDLLLCLFPFEKEWYARRVPRLRVVCVGHPVVDRCAAAAAAGGSPKPIRGPADPRRAPAQVVLLPGSRPGELARHLPVMLRAAERIADRWPARFVVVLADESSRGTVRRALESMNLEVRVEVGRLAEVLRTATLALASTGTVTLECAAFGVPAVALYIASPAEYQIARCLVGVKYLAMPNLLANVRLFPEFIQGSATPENLAGAALELLQDEPRRREIQARLAGVIESLGGPGASARAASAVAALLTGRA